MRPEPARARFERARRQLRLALGALALAPATAVAAIVSAIQRRRLARPAGVRRALRTLGLPVADGAPLAITPLGGGRANAVLAVRWPDSGAAAVLKRALPAGTVLAFGARHLGPQPFARRVSGAARLHRELVALTRLRAAGVRVPAVLAADPARGYLLLELVDGRSLPATAAEPGFLDRVTAYGRAIAAAHAAGVVLTDCHPGNALCTAGGAIVLVDLEFAEPLRALADPDARRAFDVVHAASFFAAGDERAAFLAGTGALGASSPAALPLAALEAARARVAPYLPIFRRERARQRQPQRHRGARAA